MQGAGQGSVRELSPTYLDLLQLVNDMPDDGDHIAKQRIVCCIAPACVNTAMQGRLLLPRMHSQGVLSQMCYTYDDD
jgi:hypothetical protein